NAFVARGPKSFEVKGLLRVKETVKELSFAVEYAGTIADAWGGTRAGFSFQIELDRMELGLNWNAALGAGMAVVGRKVKFSGEIELVKQTGGEDRKRDQEDSLRAAVMTQSSHLPAIQDLKAAFADVFVIFEPKDQLGGDFYWFEKFDGTATLVLADCVGHGMEGALKAMLGVSLLNQTAEPALLRDLKRFSAAVHDAVVQTVRKSHTPNPNLYAMEMGFCTLDLSKRRLQFLGAGVGLFLLRSTGAIEYLAAYKEGVGSRTYDPQSPGAYEVELEPGDRCFMISDGFKDQFGGPEGKKIGRRTVEQWFKECLGRPFAECETMLRRRFLDWRGNFEQMDDVTVVGFQPF
ncbi:MAG: SpoIIE family protein phosphatase, partial [Bacteroidia bacterium]|nr:SpoIIE family protein phosphatase [Bacteroidia bacterium]MDW8335109.1 SpoIIE family protein phosphatase [Bacteroidia bacterium]